MSLDRQPRERLSVRRRRVRRRLVVVWTLLIAIVVGAIFYGLWRPEVRVSHITVSGPDQSLATLAMNALGGTSFGVPRNSIFFVSKTRIRDAILTAHPEIAALSISRTSFTSLSLRPDYRTPIATWCGTANASTSAAATVAEEAILNPLGTCYVFDASGFIYATATAPMLAKATTTVTTFSAPQSRTTNTTPVTPFTLFDTTTTTAAPITGTLAHANQLPAVFDFARQLRVFGASVQTVVLRGQEVDFFLKPFAVASSTSRITYLLGQEQDAYAALVSAESNFNLKDGSVEYVDLRFPGKVYLKKKSPQ